MHSDDNPENRRGSTFQHASIRNDYPDRPRVAVGAVVFHRRRVLLVRRKNPPAAEEWAIPGGSVELGETLQDAAEREIREETGIRIKAHEPVYTFDHVDRDAAGRIRYHYVIVDLFADYLGGEPVAGDDAVEVRWVSAEELRGIPVSIRTVRLLRRHFGFGP
jgi:ADP-ribose pyrophosphatase